MQIFPQWPSIAHVAGARADSLMAPECSQLLPPADKAVNQTTAILPLTEHFSSEKRLSGDLKLFARAWQRQGLSRP